MAISELVQNLQNPKLFEHEIKRFSVLETHISWVILTGKYAYKLKKPVDFKFLDYTTLEKRKYFCEKELELNKRLAPELYLEVLPITGTPESPEINGKGPIIDYALKMHEFSQETMFDKLLEKNQLSLDLMLDIATELATFHGEANTDGPKDLGTVTQVHAPVTQNFDQIRPLIHDDPTMLARLEKLETWADREHERLQDVFAARYKNGFIRECHGDIHLGNITLYAGKPLIFDCIEFNEPFRWTDTMADLGFLLMDLFDKDQTTFANAVRNRYMSVTGDYQGLQVLPYYTAYRAMVRAKISMLQLRFSENDPETAARLNKAFTHFIELAESFMKQEPPRLLIMHGVAGSGKSTVAHFIVNNIGAIQIQSDVERKRLAGLAKTAKTKSGVNEDLYTPDRHEQTYQHLQSLAAEIITAGYSVIVDATFIKEQHRQLFQSLAKKLKAPFVILDCQVEPETIKNWITERQAKMQDPSEADEKILAMQLASEEPLTEKEKSAAIVIRTDNKPLNTDLLVKLRKFS